MTITSSLRFLYIFDRSGLLCAVRRPRFSNKANDAFLAAAEKQTQPSRNDEKMRKANIYVLQKKVSSS